MGILKVFIKGGKTKKSSTSFYSVDQESMTHMRYLGYRNFINFQV